jgi:FkbM family methyltransferase
MGKWSLLEFFPGSTINILDVGAALLESPPYQSLIDAGAGRLFGFEPDQQACEKLKKEFGGAHRFFQCFAGDGCPGTFYETSWAPTGSLYPPNSPLLEKFHALPDYTRLVATHAVDTVRIDDITEIDNVDFIKIDVQGSELPILQNAMRALSSAVAIQVEVEFVELYKGQPMFADVDEFLRGQGFQFHTFLGLEGRAFKPLAPAGKETASFRQHLWSDAVYVRDWMHLESLSASQLRNYAILVHDIWTSYDLAHVILAALDRSTNSRLADAYVRRLTGRDPPKP